MTELQEQEHREDFFTWYEISDELIDRIKSRLSSDKLDIIKSLKNREFSEKSLYNELAERKFDRKDINLILSCIDFSFNDYSDIKTFTRISYDASNLFQGGNRVSGCVITNESLDRIEIYINNELIGNASYGDGRAEAEKLYSFIPNSKTSVFFLDVPNLNEIINSFLIASNKINLNIKVIPCTLR